MTVEAKQLLTDSEFAIRALREYIQALPDEVVASLPGMPGIDGDWLDVLQANLHTANTCQSLGAVQQYAVPVAVVKAGNIYNRLEWLSDELMGATPVGSMLCIATFPAEEN
jgi:enolase